MKTNKLLILAAVFALTACASDNPDNSYVSAAEYQDYSCKQLGAELSRVSKRIETVQAQSASDQTSAVLNSAITALAITQGYGVYDDSSEGNDQLKRLQSQYDTIEKLSIQKNCMDK